MECESGGIDPEKPLKHDEKMSNVTSLRDFTGNIEQYSQVNYAMTLSSS